MNRIMRMSFVILALAVANQPKPVCAAHIAQTRVQGAAATGGITVLPVSAVTPNIGGGALLTPASPYKLSGSLSLPQAPRIAAPTAARDAIPHDAATPLSAPAIRIDLSKGTMPVEVPSALQIGKVSELLQDSARQDGSKSSQQGAVAPGNVEDSAGRSRALFDGSVRGRSLAASEAVAVSVFQSSLKPSGLRAPRSVARSRAESRGAGVRGYEYVSDVVQKYGDVGQAVGGAAGVLLGLGAAAGVYILGASIGTVILIGVVGTMGAALALASLGQGRGFQAGHKSVEREMNDFLVRHGRTIRSIPGVADIHYERALPMLDDAMTAAGDSLFQLTLDETVPYEQVLRELKAQVPGIKKYTVFFDSMQIM